MGVSEDRKDSGKRDIRVWQRQSTARWRSTRRIGQFRYRETHRRYPIRLKISMVQSIRRLLRLTLVMEGLGSVLVGRRSGSVEVCTVIVCVRVLDGCPEIGRSTDCQLYPKLVLTCQSRTGWSEPVYPC
jgi:hypothetical protein